MGLLVIFFPTNRGIRQGDPLSLHLFLVFIESLFQSIMSNTLVDGVFISGSNAFAMKYFAYADNVTLMLSETHLVSKAFDLLLEYEMTTGLRISFKKSKFCFAAKTKHFFYF